MVAPSAVTPSKLSPAHLSISIVSCEKKREASATLVLRTCACNSQIVLHSYALQAPAARIPK